MSAYHGDVALNQTIDIQFTTTTTAGVPIVLAGTPVISAYIGNSVTQLTAGITLTVNLDGVVGLNNVRVVASSGNGYAAATDVSLIITTGTVDGASVVGYAVGSFSIENRVSNVTKFGGTAGTFSGGRPEVNTSHAAGTAWGSGAITAAAIAADAIGASELAADAASEIGTAVWATAARTLTAGTNIALAKGTGVTGFNDLSAAQVNAEVVDVLTVDTFAEPAAVPAATASLKDKLGWLAALARNKKTQTATTTTLRNDADAASIATSTTSDDGTTATASEWT